MTNRILTRKSVPAMLPGISGATALAIGAMLLPATPALAQTPPANCVGKNPGKSWINLEIENVRSNDGTITITAYPDNKQTFLKKNGEVQVARINAQQGTTKGCILVPSTGVYALALYHDENGNRKLDRNPLPKEGYGFTNNPGTFFGLPAFKSVRMSFPANGTTANIRMKYP